VSFTHDVTAKPKEEFTDEPPPEVWLSLDTPRQPDSSAFGAMWYGFERRNVKGAPIVRYLRADLARFRREGGDAWERFLRARHEYIEAMHREGAPLGNILATCNLSDESHVAALIKSFELSDAAEVPTDEKTSSAWICLACEEVRDFWDPGPKGPHASAPLGADGITTGHLPCGGKWEKLETFARATLARLATSRRQIADLERVSREWSDDAIAQRTKNSIAWAILTSRDPNATRTSDSLEVEARAAVQRLETLKQDHQNALRCLDIVRTSRDRVGKLYSAALEEIDAKQRELDAARGDLVLAARTFAAKCEEHQKTIGELRAKLRKRTTKKDKKTADRRAESIRRGVETRRIRREGGAA
jgi:hypothetical protein